MNTKLLFLCLVLAYASANTTGSQTSCLSACFNTSTLSFPPGCCGCCPSGSFCAGNAIAPVCCRNNQQFCGCLSNRAFCEGSIFNSTQTVPPFGTCFNPSPSQGTCCYFPAPNVWKICPANTTCCGGVISGPNSITCCTSSQTCSISSSGIPSCVPKPPATNTCNGRVFNPATHRCINGVLCGINNGVCKGGQCYDPRNAVCFPQPCAGALQGSPSADVLCGRGLVNCGGICINPSGYFCKNGTVQQRPATGIQCGSTVCTGSQQCCQSNQPGFPFAQCYDPSTSSCARDPRGFGALATRVCPLSPFDKAQGACLLLPSSTLQCFDIDTQFCCQQSSPGGTAASVLPIGASCPRNNPCRS